MPRGVIPTLLIAFAAVIFFSLGNLLAARQAVTSDSEQIAELRAELGVLKRQRTGVGTAGRLERWTITAAPRSSPTSSSS